MLDRLEIPIVQAPMAGGPSTPQLAAAVSEAGGLGFVAAGYRAPAALAEDVAATRALTPRPFGVNVFAPGGRPADPELVRRYAAGLEAEATRAGVELGRPVFDDDAYEAKLAHLVADPVAVVSFTFGCPAPGTVARLQESGSAVWVTVTDADEARQAEAAGADALVVQGMEAGGHRGTWVDRPGDVDHLGSLALLQLVAAASGLPRVATGGIATGAGVAAVLAAGASAAQVGSAFMLCPEAGTSPVHRAALAAPGPTGLTRAFTGRLARGIVNRLQADFTARAPLAYPEIHHVTAPLRAHGRRSGDAGVVNLWAGQAHELAQERPAAEVVARLAAEARAGLEVAARRLGTAPPHSARA
jgi:nitronate monooxygenase